MKRQTSFEGDFVHKKKVRIQEKANVLENHSFVNDDIDEEEIDDGVDYELESGSLDHFVT